MVKLVYRRDSAGKWSDLNPSISHKKVLNRSSSFESHLLRLSCKTIASTIMRKQEGSCYFSRVPETYLLHGKFDYLSVCVTLFVPSVYCANARSIFTFTGAKLVIMMLAAAAGLLREGKERNVRVIKEAGRPNTKGLDILRNHSLWNVIDGGDFCSGTFFFFGMVYLMYISIS